jgi:tRNA-dihydrouridine synthase A
VKCRLGVDDVDKWENIVHFIKTVSEKGGVNKFIIHARKAFLKGLDPK